MVPPVSRRISRALRYSGYPPLACLPLVRGFHPLRQAVPSLSDTGMLDHAGPTTPPAPERPRFGLLPVRSPLLGESQLFSPPMGT